MCKKNLSSDNYMKLVRYSRRVDKLYLQPMMVKMYSFSLMFHSGNFHVTTKTRKMYIYFPQRTRCFLLKFLHDDLLTSVLTEPKATP